MYKKVCTYCNGCDLFLYNMEGPAATYVCAKCGHMEWFLNDDNMRLFFMHERQQLETEILNLQNQIYELQNLSSDKNAPANIINEAQENIAVLQKKLKLLDAELEIALKALSKLTQ